MIRKHLVRLAGIALAGLFLFSGCQQEVLIPEGAVTVHPKEDTQTVLSNPDMGWVAYDNYLVSETESPASKRCGIYGYDYPGVDHIMLKFTWADIETKEGKYDFSRFDYIYDYWKGKGKKIQLGMSTESLLWYGFYGMGIPTYVTEKMDPSKIQKRTYNYGRSGTYRVVDANDPYYMERMTAFLKEMSDHMTETGRTVDYIDLRGYGLWGEWHSGYQYATLEEKRTALDGIMKAWSEAFPDTWLCLSYSWDPDAPGGYNTDPARYEDFLYWSAFDLAKKYTNFAFRRDGCDGAILANDRAFCDEMFPKLTYGPFTSEGAQGYENSDNAKRIIEDGLSLHANYFTLVGWGNYNGQAFIQNEPQLMTYGHLNMGYRFSARKISYTAAVEAGGELTLAGIWKNSAVGRAVRDYEFALILQKDGGEEQVLNLGKSGCDKWIKGQEYVTDNKITLPDSIAKGTYQASLALIDPADGGYIRLAMEGTEADHTRLPLGELVIH